MAITEKPEDLEKDAFRLISGEGDIESYYKIKQEKGGWDDNDVDQFSGWFDSLHDNEKFMAAAQGRDRTQEAAEAAYKEQVRPTGWLERDIMEGGARDVITGMRSAVTNLSALGMRALGEGQLADDVTRETQLENRLTQEVNVEEFGEQNIVQRNVGGVAGSIFTAMTGGPAAIPLFAGARGNEAIIEADDAGLKGKEKWSYVGRAAAIEGVITTAFSVFGKAGFEKFFKGSDEITAKSMREVLKQIGVSSAEELPEELVIGLLDEYNQEISNIEGADLNWETVWDIFKDTTVATLMTVGSSGAVKGIGDVKNYKDITATVEGMGFEPEVAARIIDKAAEAKGDFNTALGKQIEVEKIKTVDGLNDWAQSNPEAAVEIASLEKPSRKQFADAGLPSMAEDVRAGISASLRDMALAQAEADAAQAADPETTFSVAPGVDVEFEQPAGVPVDPAQVATEPEQAMPQVEGDAEAEPFLTAGPDVDVEVSDAPKIEPLVEPEPAQVVEPEPAVEEQFDAPEDTTETEVVADEPSPFEMEAESEEERVAIADMGRKELRGVANELGLNQKQYTALNTDDFRALVTKEHEDQWVEKVEGAKKKAHQKVMNKIKKLNMDENSNPVAQAKALVLASEKIKYDPSMSPDAWKKLPSIYKDNENGRGWDQYLNEIVDSDMGLDLDANSEADALLEILSTKTKDDKGLPLLIPAEAEQEISNIGLDDGQDRLNKELIQSAPANVVNQTMDPNSERMFSVKSEEFSDGDIFRVEDELYRVQNLGGEMVMISQDGIVEPIGDAGIDFSVNAVVGKGNEAYQTALDRYNRMDDPAVKAQEKSDVRAVEKREAEQDKVYKQIDALAKAPSEMSWSDLKKRAKDVGVKIKGTRADVEQRVLESEQAKVAREADAKKTKKRKKFVSPTESLEDAEKARLKELTGSVLSKLTTNVGMAGTQAFDKETMAQITEIVGLYTKGTVKSFENMAMAMKEDFGDAWSGMKGAMYDAWEARRKEDPSLEPITPEDAEAIIAEESDAKPDETNQDVQKYDTALEKGFNKGPFFHGTHKVFNSFSSEKVKGSDFDKIGHWFSNLEEGAKGYGPILKKVMLDLKNPKTYTGRSLSRLYDDVERLGSKSFVEDLKSKGYDGIVVESVKESDSPIQSFYVAFESRQILSWDDIESKAVKPVVKPVVKPNKPKPVVKPNKPKPVQETELKLEPEVPLSEVGPENAVSASHAQSDKTRERLGLPERTESKILEDQALSDNTNAAFAENPNVGRNLVAAVKQEKGRVLNAQETIILAREIYEAQDELRKIMASETEMLQNEEYGEKFDALEDQAVEANERLNNALDVADEAGSEAGRAFRARQLLLGEDFSIQRMRNELRKAQKGGKLTSEQKEDVDRMSRELKALQDQIDEDAARHQVEIEKAEQETRDAWAAEAWATRNYESILKNETAAKTKRRLTLAEKFEAKSKAIFKGMRGKAFSIEGAAAEVLSAASYYGAAQLLRGTVKLSEWTAKVKAKFNQLNDTDILKVRSESQKLVKEEMKSAAPVTKKGGKKAEPVNLNEADEAVLSKEIKARMKVEVESGETSLNTALDSVHKDLTDEGLDITRDDVRDLFSDYGKQKNPDNTPVKKILADMRRQAQLLASIQRVQAKLAPLKSGSQRDAPTAKVRELTKKLNKLMKDANFVTEDSDAQLASELQRRKTRAENDIEDLSNAIKTQTQLVKQSGKLPQIDDQLRDLNKTRDALRKDYNEMFPKEPMTDQERAERALKHAEKMLERSRKELEDAKKNIFKDTRTRDLPKNLRLEQIRAELKSNKQTVKDLTEMAAGKEFLAAKAKQKRLEASIKMMEAQMKSGDFSAKEKIPVNMKATPESWAAMKRYELKKREWSEMKLAAEWEEMNNFQKGMHGLRNARELVRSLKFAADVSFAGRQGFMYLLSHPIKWSKGTVRSVAALNAKKSAQYSKQLHEDAPHIYDLMRVAKLGISEANKVGNFDTVDDLSRMEFARKIPGVGKFITDPSGRSFATGGNEFRAGLFKMALEGSAVGKKILSEQLDGESLSKSQTEHLKTIGWGINLITGTTNLKGAEVFSSVMGAPKFVASIFGTILFAPLVHSGVKQDKAAAAFFAKEYARAYSTLAVIYALTQLLNGDDDDDEENDVDWNMISSDLGNVQITKDVSLNVLGPNTPQLKFLFRMFAGRMKSPSGMTIMNDHWTPLLAEEYSDQEEKEGAYGKFFANYIRTKLHPAWGAGWSLMTKEDYMGNEQSYKRLLAEAFIPITPLEGYDALQQVSPANAALVMALESFGFSSGMDYDSAAAIRLSSMNEEVFKETVGKRIIAGTSPGSDERDMVRLIKATEGMKFDDALAIMQANMKERNPKADFAERYANGNLTPYALRKKDLKELMETLDPTVPAGRKIWKGLRHNAKLLDKKIMKAELEVLDKDEARSKLKDYFKRKGYATQYRSGKYGRGSKTSYGEMRDLLDEFYKD